MSGSYSGFDFSSVSAGTFDSVTGGNATALPTTALDQTTTTASTANVSNGGANGAINGKPSTPTQQSRAGSSTPTPPDKSMRIKISPLNGAQFWGQTASSGPTSIGAVTTGTPTSGNVTNRTNPSQPTSGNASSSILSPIINTGGVIFPYSPSIQFSQEVDYTPASMIQTNSDYYAYQRTPSVSLTIVGKFSVQTQKDGAYALAAIHFFRAASKMYFGESAGSKAGLPPPILQLSGYGTYMFNKLNCILKSHSFQYDPQMDTIPIVISSGSVRLPPLFDLSVTLIVQQTPQNMRTKFDLDKFRTGQLMTQGGWI